MKSRDIEPTEVVADPPRIYNGDVKRREPEALRSNKPVRPKRRSSLTLVAGIACLSFLVVLYVWNKICVNTLKEEIGELEIQHESILNSNKILRQKIDQNTTLDRVSKLASERLGMIHAVEQPVWFELRNPSSLHEGSK